MSGMSFSGALRDARAQSIIDAISGDSEHPGIIRAYTLPYPAAECGPITTQTLIGTCTLFHPAGSVSNGLITFFAIAQDDLIDNTGDAAFLRVISGRDGSALMDVRVTPTFVDDPANPGQQIPGAGPALMADIHCIKNGVFKILSFTLREGNAQALS